MLTAQPCVSYEGVSHALVPSSSLHMQHETIEQLLERGEKLDDLVQKTDMLSGTSKAFYKEVLLTSVQLKHSMYQEREVYGLCGP